MEPLLNSMPLGRPALAREIMPMSMITPEIRKYQ